MLEELLPLQTQSISKTSGRLSLAGGPLTYEGLTSLCFYGYGPTMTLPDHCYSKKELHGKSKHWVFAQECSVTTKFLRESLPFKNIDRIRLQFLHPGGVLGPHKDNHDDFLSSINVTVSNPHNCHFIYKDHGDICLQDGDVYLMNTSHTHSVVNLSNKHRVSLVVLGDLDLNAAL